MCKRLLRSMSLKDKEEESRRSGGGWLLQMILCENQEKEGKRRRIQQFHNDVQCQEGFEKANESF